MYIKTFTLLIIFFKISVTSFGGIYSVWALTEEIFVITEQEEQEIHEKNTGTIDPVLNNEEFKKIFSISQLIPGPKTSSLSLIGLKYGAILPMTAIYIGLILPGLILIPVLNYTGKFLSRYPVFEGFRQGVKLAVISILLLFCVGLLKKGTGYDIDKSAFFILIASTTFFLNKRYKVNPILLILGSAVLGYFFM